MTETIIDSVAVIRAIKRACASRRAAGKSLVGSDPRYPNAIVEETADGRRFLVRMEKANGVRTFKRLSEIGSRATG